MDGAAFADYAAAVAAMEARAAAIATAQAGEMVWLTQHPAIYTTGPSADSGDFIAPARYPVHATGRGGRCTWHGPGQRVVYMMLDLNRRGRDVRAFVANIEAWIAETLDTFGVCAERLPGRPGLWVRRRVSGADGIEVEKIAAIGLRLRKWVSSHGASINVSPDLSAFDAIVPCGNPRPPYGVTSLRSLGVEATMAELDAVLRRCFTRRFGPVRCVPPPV